jgi:hypothetical protein
VEENFGAGGQETARGGELWLTITTCQPKEAMENHDIPLVSLPSWSVAVLSYLVYYCDLALVT